ncbi:hypothetical protein CQ017_17670 [Arthrobacter sp. MYb224]|nr:hypothetical protein CQ017_17670 [Arthrobacter sp. MYb224]
MRREGGQVRAAEAGRRGSVGHVEVFRMDGVGTSIVGRPRRLSADRRARPTYTLIWEEPSISVACSPPAAKDRASAPRILPGRCVAVAGTNWLNRSSHTLRKSTAFRKLVSTDNPAWETRD